MSSTPPPPSNDVALHRPVGNDDSDTESSGSDAMAMDFELAVTVDDSDVGDDDERERKKPVHSTRREVPPHRDATHPVITEETIHTLRALSVNVQDVLDRNATHRDDWTHIYRHSINGEALLLMAPSATVP